MTQVRSASTSTRSFALAPTVGMSIASSSVGAGESPTIIGIRRPTRRSSIASRRLRAALQTIADCGFRGGGYHRREICRMLPPVLLWAGIGPPVLVEVPMNWALIEFASADGLRANGRRRARRDHRRDREARHEAVPSSGRAIRLEAMADADHPRARAHLAGRRSVTS